MLKASSEAEGRRRMTLSVWRATAFPQTPHHPPLALPRSSAALFGSALLGSLYSARSFRLALFGSLYCLSAECFTAIRSSAARSPRASVAASLIAQKCMKKSRGSSSSMWLCNAVISI